MKYNDNGEYKDIYVKAFDTLPVGTEVDYDGSTVPQGWTEISDMSGSNENGNWVKFADGTMICTKVVTGTANITTANGTLYSSTEIDLGVYPMAFISRPIVNITPTKSDGSGYQYFMMTGETAVSNNLTNAPYITLLRTSSRQSVAYRIELIAIGRWK